MAEAKNQLSIVDHEAGEFLQTFGKSLKDYAMRPYDSTGFLKSAMIAIADSKDLAECLKTDAGRRSLFNALRKASTTGLSLNPQDGKAALIAYGGKVTYQTMKNGLVDLALESGAVEFISADVVRENDEFVCPANPSDNYTYRPARKNRGGIDGYFAVMKLNTGSLHFKWMTAEEVAIHRKEFSAHTKMPEIGYGLKTVLKALLRSTSISKALDHVLASDEYIEPEFVTQRGTSADDVLKKIETPKKVVAISEPESLL